MRGKPYIIVFVQNGRVSCQWRGIGRWSFICSAAYNLEIKQASESQIFATPESCNLKLKNSCQILLLATCILACNLNWLFWFFLDQASSDMTRRTILEILIDRRSKPVEQESDGKHVAGVIPVRIVVQVERFSWIAQLWLNSDRPCQPKFMALAIDINGMPGDRSSYKDRSLIHVLCSK